MADQRGATNFSLEIELLREAVECWNTNAMTLKRVPPGTAVLRYVELQPSATHAGLPVTAVVVVFNFHTSSARFQRSPSRPPHISANFCLAGQLSHSVLGPYVHIVPAGQVAQGYTFTITHNPRNTPFSLKPESFDDHLEDAEANDLLHSEFDSTRICCIVRHMYQYARMSYCHASQSSYL